MVFVGLLFSIELNGSRHTFLQKAQLFEILKLTPSFHPFAMENIERLVLAHVDVVLLGFEVEDNDEDDEDNGVDDGVGFVIGGTVIAPLL